MEYLLVIASLGALIFLHELGHLLVALKLGVPVERFSLGFGPRIWGFEWRGVEYRISLIPFGGYVLPRVKDLEDFHRISVWKRILFSLGGPLANIFTAYICYLAVIISINRDPWAPLTALYQVVLSLYTVLISYGMLFMDPSLASGALGIVTQGGAFVGGSMVRLLVFSAFLSLNLALFNLLPVPVLDGGKILFALLEKVDLRTRKLQLPATLISLVFLILVIALTSIMDVLRLL